MEELDLKQLTGILWRKKFTLIFIILIFTIAGLVYTFNFVEPMYKSTCTIILGRVISSNNGFQDLSSYQETDMISQSDLTLNSSLIETYSELVKSKSLIHEAADALNSKIDEEEIMKSVSVSRVNNSDLLEVTATNRDSKLARDIVKSVVNIFSENVKEIYNISNVYVIDDATIEDLPYNINHARDVLIFALIGLFVSSGYVLLYNIIDNTVKGSYDIETVLKSKILITIPFDKKNKKEELITVNDPKSVISETFRTLRTNVQFSSINSKGSKTLLITSCLPEEGKSYISANLAITFAQAGKKVVIVDSDMRRGRQSKIFNVPNHNGLSNYISNLDNNGNELNWSVGKFIKETNISNLNIITAGNIPPNPSELLESEKVPELIEELKKYYDVVIFDGAPILPITDSLILGRLLGNTMLVSVYNKTKRDNLQKAKSSIENVGGKVIGIVLNKTTETSSEYVGNYYYYGKEEEKKFSDKIKKALPSKAKLDIIIRKIKSIHKRLAEKSTAIENEKAKKREEKRIEREEYKKKKDKEKKIALAEKAKRDAEIAAENAKREAELAIEREKEEAALAEEQAKREEEERIKKEEAAKKKAEEDKKKQEEREAKKKENDEKREIKKKENAEKRQAFKEDFNRKKVKFKEVSSAKFAKFKETSSKKWAEFKEWLKVKRADLAKKYAEYKVKKAEEKAKREEEARIKAEEKAKREAELARIAEEERKKREEEERVLAEERAREEAIMAEERAKREAEEQAKREEEERIRAEERAKKEAELAIIREQERVKREEERKKREEERAQREAERIRKEEELKRQKEEERKKKEEERVRLQEIKAARELEIAKQREEEKIKKEEAKIKKAEDAKFTDEYLEENLYPKTKFNKF